MDKAGQEFWEDHWQKTFQADFRPRSGKLRDYRDTELADLIDRALSSVPRDGVVLEAGCADSLVLPYLSGRHRVAGVDYSDTGCDRLRARLKDADIECCDLFKPSARLIGKHDAAVSFGLVEHFSDTATVVRAIAALVKPDGAILTVIPNMRGMTGFVQNAVAPSIYRVHVPLSIDELVKGHEDAGLNVIEANYLLPVGFGVVNYNEPNIGSLRRFSNRAIGFVLARLSWGAWFIDNRIGKLPKSDRFSPFVYCIARRPRQKPAS